MASSGLSINSVVLTIIAVAIGLVLIGSLLAPTAQNVMNDLNALGGDGASWANLVGVVVIVSILGLIIVAVNEYTKKS
jgi:hypothetical protein